ncbi:MAG: hypothetical protein OK436_07610, partial [Thaumarchaeota archaeon]|nr:hypothetical protein [Nitrososphaerota archaeon]
PYCVSCPLSECEWNDNKHRAQEDRIVTIRNFESDFTAVLANIAPLCRKIGDIAVEEMRSMRRLEMA